MNRRAGRGCCLLAVLASAAGAGDGSRIPAWSLREERLEGISRAYLGVPYRRDCLGEGRLPDADPIFTRSRADCQTLVEQVLAEALAPWLGGFGPAVRRLRYRAGEVDIANRHHFCVPDWLEGPWPVTDITASARPGSAVTLRRRIDPAGVGLSREARAALNPREVAVSILPTERVAGLATEIPGGLIAAAVSPRPGLVVGHLGFVFRRGAQLRLRHASSRHGRVVDEALPSVLRRLRSPGLILLRPDVRGLDRPEKAVP